MIFGADDLDIVFRILRFVPCEAARTSLRRVSQTWRSAYQLLRAGPRILVLVEWKILICDELGRPMHTVKLTPPQIERQKLDSNGAWSIRIEPAYAIKSLVVLGDLAIVGYHQGYLQAIDMISRSQRWLKRAEDADVNLPAHWNVFKCIAATANRAHGGTLAVGASGAAATNQVVFFEPQTGDALRKLSVPLGGELSCLALSRDGSKVAAGTSIGATFPSADDDGLVVLCAVSGVVLHRIRARQFTTVVNTVAFVAPDRLATGSNDSRLRLWRLSGPGEVLAPVHWDGARHRSTGVLLSDIACEDWVRSCAASSDERFLVCCSNTRDRRRSNVDVYESHPTDGLLLRASTQTDKRHRATFCDAGILLTPVSRFDAPSRRVLVWDAKVADLAQGLSVDSPAQIASHGFGRGEFVAPTAWHPSAAFRDYPAPSQRTHGILDSDLSVD